MPCKTGCAQGQFLTATCTTRCMDTPGFKDSWGSCANYEDNEWCTKSGDNGSGWDETWGELDPAVVASCCACGKASQSTDYTCKACRDRTSCPANHHLAGICSGHSDYSCGACPAHAESSAGATEASQCTCAANYYDGDTAAQGVNCKSCRSSCSSANEYVSTKCGAVDSAHGVDASCSTCPAHSTLKAQSGRRLFGVHGAVATAPLIQDCVCDSGYFDDELAQSRVHCATVPPGFGSTYTSTTCQFSKFGLGATRCKLRIQLMLRDCSRS